ncbi:ABC transporter permease subunit [Mesorhizobium sp. CU2]|uniref:ABC transporter permease n=1 Tax=unclassified Mesorhizobium TaxID=325217 RepID=UPI00112A84A3|nr:MULTISPECIES: ABC transporter permease subunit [unclassified Mesorhizobium]TPN85634.1 ABC transporter permease subunit [Mesorhizobium sp. CU3]TPO04715.1 ABC transporter permease subunit [Mesorhizobium sp. CU2]
MPDADKTASAAAGPAGNRRDPSASAMQGNRSAGARAPAALLRHLAGFIIPVLIVVVWETAARIGAVNTLLLPAPSRVFLTLGQAALDGSLWINLAYSIRRWILGFAIGGGLALFLGALNGLSLFSERLSDTTVQMLRTVPFMGLTPLLVMWFGLGETPKVILIAVASFFPVYINTLAGVRNVNRGFVEVGQSFEFSKAELLLRVILPAALPEILTGIRYALGIAWLALVIAELMAAQSGIGYWLMQGREAVRVDVVLASLIVFSLAGKLMDVALRLIEARVLHWRNAFSGS